MSLKEFESYLLDATEAKAIDKILKIGKLREVVFTMSVDNLISAINSITSVRELNVLLSVGLTSRANEAAMFRRKILYETGRGVR